MSVVRAYVDRIETPLGPMLAVATSGELLLLEFLERRAVPLQIRRIARALGGVFAPGRPPVLDQTQSQLAEYFAGARREFDIPLLTPGTTFQRAVWNALRGIEAGSTRSYTEVARQIGRGDAVRAVASANGANAIAIVIPCHRVIGSGRQLTGYGGGIWRKRRLLELEGAL